MDLGRVAEIEHANIGAIRPSFRMIIRVGDQDTSSKYFFFISVRQALGVVDIWVVLPGVCRRGRVWSRVNRWDSRLPPLPRRGVLWRGYGTSLEYDPFKVFTLHDPINIVRTFQHSTYLHTSFLPHL